MVKILSIFIATLAAVSPVAQAGACKKDILNCGSTLQKFRKESPLQKAPMIGQNAKLGHLCAFNSRHSWS
ncbi:hypothetical protein E4U59_000024 [Claviceps monticola]|nr:hypothetical protein E4U59_000024 [Claviceps monticola]